MLHDRHPELSNYSRPELLQLAEELIEEALHGEENRAIAEHLERSIAEYEANPDSAKTWPQVRAKMRLRKWRGYAANSFAELGNMGVDELIAEMRGRE